MHQPIYQRACCQSKNSFAATYTSHVLCLTLDLLANFLGSTSAPKQQTDCNASMRAVTVMNSIIER